MATAPEKKVIAPTKAAVIPAKKIATAAAKAVAKKTAIKAKPQAVAKVSAKAAPVKKTNSSKPVASTAVKAAPAKPEKSNGKGVVKSAASEPVAALVKEKTKKEKLVRDSFTMPETEYAVLSQVKKACLSAGIEVKKSQLLRIGLLLLSKTNVASLKTLIANLEPLKAGRPKKDK